VRSATSKALLANLHSGKAHVRPVGELRPKPGVIITSGISVAEAARLMAGAKQDAALVLSSLEDTLEGILTDTDVVRKVLAVGLDPEATHVCDVMTRTPFCVEETTPTADALAAMIEFRCRHLPVVSSADRHVVGLLDIAKLLFDAMAAADQLPASQRTLADVLRDDMASARHGAVPTQRLMQAATLMSERRSALVVTDGHDVVGILTPKDVLFKAVATGLPVETTPVGQVMTHAPDLLPGNVTVLQALHQLSTAGYRTVPVVGADGGPLGVLDILSLVRFALTTVEDEPVPQAEAAKAPEAPKSAPPDILVTQPAGYTSLLFTGLTFGVLVAATAFGKRRWW